MPVETGILQRPDWLDACFLDTGIRRRDDSLSNSFQALSSGLRNANAM